MELSFDYLWHILETETTSLCLCAIFLHDQWLGVACASVLCKLCLQNNKKQKFSNDKDVVIKKAQKADIIQNDIEYLEFYIYVYVLPICRCIIICFHE